MLYIARRRYISLVYRNNMPKRRLHTGVDVILQTLIYIVHSRLQPLCRRNVARTTTNVVPYSLLF